MTYPRFLLVCLFAAVITLACAPAHSEMRYTDRVGDGVLVHQTTPCPADIAQRAQQGMRGYYVAATVFIDGKAHRACAAIVSVPQLRGPQVHVILEGLGDDVFPLEDFKYEAPKATT